MSLGWYIMFFLRYRFRTPILDPKNVNTNTKYGVNTYIEQEQKNATTVYYPNNRFLNEINVLNVTAVSKDKVDCSSFKLIPGWLHWVFAEVRRSFPIKFANLFWCAGVVMFLLYKVTKFILLNSKVNIKNENLYVLS